MQRADAAAVATDLAAPPGLGDKDELHLAPALAHTRPFDNACIGNSRDPPARTPSRRADCSSSSPLPCRPPWLHAWSALQDAPAGPRSSGRSCVSQCRTVPLLRPTAVAISAIDIPASTSDSSSSRASCPLRRMLLAVAACKPVFLDPVGDRRFMPTEAPPDLRQRQTLPEKLLQRSAIHALHCRTNIRSCRVFCANFVTLEGPRSAARPPRRTGHLARQTDRPSPGRRPQPSLSPVSSSTCP